MRSDLSTFLPTLGLLAQSCIEENTQNTKKPTKKQKKIYYIAKPACSTVYSLIFLPPLCHNSSPHRISEGDFKIFPLLSDIGTDLYNGYLDHLLSPSVLALISISAVANLLITMYFVFSMVSLGREVL